MAGDSSDADRRVGSRQGGRSKNVASRTGKDSRALKSPLAERAHHSESGRVDTTFGKAGAVFGDFKGVSAVASAIVVQRDKSIVIVGTVGNRNTAVRNIGVLRFSEDGDLDASFGDRGSQIIGIKDRLCSAHAATQQVDGKLIVAGDIFDRSRGLTEFLLVRLDAVGRIDPGFNGGVAKPAFYPGVDYRARAVAVQPDGGIVTAGSSYRSRAYIEQADIALGSKAPAYAYDTEQFVQTRHHESGLVDQSFGFGGRFETLMAPGPGARAEVRALHVLVSGHILAAGFTSAKDPNRMRFLAVARYLPDGKLDSTFGTGALKGTVWRFMEGKDEGAYALSVQPNDGKLVLAGEAAADANSTRHFMIVRLNPDGTADPTFNKSGFAINKSFAGYARAVVVLPDGRIVAAGCALVDSRTADGKATIGTRIALVAYLPDGSIDQGFGERGAAFVSLGGERDSAEAIAFVNDKILVAATSSVGEKSTIAILRICTK